MAIKITIGLGLDDTKASPHKDSAGELLVGPSQLLGWLESQLALELPDVSFTKRMLQYLACLKAANPENRFYYQSMQMDELGVARRLLHWRDKWYEAGWDGNLFDKANQRLNDIAEIEQLARNKVALNTGQRVQRVLKALQNCSLDINITTIDPIDVYPSTMQQLLNLLDAIYQNPHIQSRAQQGSDLEQLQTLLLSSEIPKDPQPLTSDGSVVVLKAPSDGISAPWIAQYCKQLVSEADDTPIGLLSSGSSDELDIALEDSGVAILAAGERSPWRPVFQVLPLALDLLWSPLNPHRLLEFLSHPVGPIPRRIRQRLATVVAEEPGIGGEKWQKTIKKILKNEKKAASGKTKKQIKSLKRSFRFWLENERYKTYPGAPVEIVLQRSSAVNDWLLGLISQIIDEPEKASELSLFYSAQNQVLEFNKAVEELKKQGSENINIDTLRRLIKAVRGEGAKRPDRQAQIIPGQKKLNYGTDPAVFIAPLHTTIWWGCDRASITTEQSWSLLEEQMLKANGVALLADEKHLSWKTSSWLRPILAAKEQLILVIHENTEGHHPLFDQINTLVTGYPEYELLGLIQQGKSIALVNSPISVTVPELTLPHKKRLWQLPESTSLPTREMESFSSLENFLFGPYMWVLRYQAKLRAGTLLSVSDRNLLKGNLAHKLFENYFNANPDISNIKVSEINHWAEPELNNMIETTGAVLLLPGRTAERENFIHNSLSALTSLVVHLQTANVVSVEMELRSEGIFTGGELMGYMDLLATKADGSEAVVDIKWGGTKYRRESIAKSMYLQLAIYARLRLQAKRVFPAVGYFIINTQELLMLNSDYFADAEIIAPENEENIASFWNRFEKTWRQRRKQLNDGLVEVNITGTEIDDSLLFDEDCLEHQETFDKFNEFTAILGWEADA